MMEQSVQGQIIDALKTVRRPLKRTELAQQIGLSVSKTREVLDALVIAGVVQRDLRVVRGTKTFFYRLEGNPWQPKRGRYTTVLCPCGRRVILARVRLAGFENWYSMICKGCHTMRYLPESDLL